MLVPPVERDISYIKQEGEIYYGRGFETTSRTQKPADRILANFPHFRLTHIKDFEIPCYEAQITSMIQSLLNSMKILYLLHG